MPHKRLGAILELYKDWPLGWVYCIKDAGGIVVYIGASEDLDERITAHKVATNQHQPDLRQWIALNPHTFGLVSHHMTKRAMLDAERQAIEELRPRFNARYNTVPADYPMN